MLKTMESRENIILEREKQEEKVAQKKLKDEKRRQRVRRRGGYIQMYSDGQSAAVNAVITQ